MSRTACISRVSRGTGKWYFEIIFAAYSPSAIDTLSGWGLTQDATPAVDEGISSDSIWVSRSGVGFSNGTSLGSLLSGFTTGDVLMVAVDFAALTPDSVKVWLGLNGSWIGDPVAGMDAVNEVALGLSGDYYVMNSYIYVSGEGPSIRLAATSSQQQFPAPSGFAPWEA